ncbi:RsmB/NOP family class I SAM-dependent RNA methyltransferase [Rosettibacter firmus]|uniref:RsmB/NOP family class I SAM-dependent RNA methyltransferase n=1 Tax=Rosettibacter firmus TaxID=3111522 RepID=UPI00336BF188
MILLSEKIENYILQTFGDDYLKKYKEFYHSNYGSYIRLSNKADADNLITNLKNYGIQLEKIEPLENVYKVIAGEDLIGKTFYYILGYYYIQSLSSMIPAIVLNPSENDRVLDLCAAPGSKTTQISDLMKNKGTLIANDISLDRLKVLMFNLDKMNSINVGVLNKKGELLSKYFENYFDKILVDAPCSALGIVQKKGEVSNWWNINKIGGIADIQYKLLLSAIKILKPGGTIVYSTCTLTLEENELVLNRILKKYPVKLVDIKLPIKSHPAFTKYNQENLDESLAFAKRILPWEVYSEGFFVSKLVKTDKLNSETPTIHTSKKIELLSYNNARVKDFLFRVSDYYGIDENIFDDYKYITRSKDLYFVNKDWQAENPELFNRIGSKFGSIDKNKIVQIHTSAAQILGKYSSKNIVELDDKKELEIYFNGGTIKKDYGKEGQKIVKYQGLTLGTAVQSKDGLKSQFPRSLRTQEIVIA